MRRRQGCGVWVGVLVPGSGGASVGTIGVAVGGSGVSVGGTVGGVVLGRSVGVGGGNTKPTPEQSPSWLK
jgi:hypothetical protein